nr:CoA pyrophosphatase [Euzebyaceae bacterium]
MDAWSRIGAALDDLEPAAIAPPAGGRIGAALVLIAETGDGDLEVVYTRRREDLSNHPGQVSFPGGGVDPGETVEEAALREANEEIGLDPATATVCGRLPPFYIPPSRFWLQAVIARWDAPHPLVGAEAEVAEILRVRLSTLRDPGVWRGVNMSTVGWSWAWQLDTEHLLWGATAMVTAALLGVVSPEWHGGAAPADLGPDRQPRPWERRAFTTARVRPARLPGLSEITEAELTAAQA